MRNTTMYLKFVCLVIFIASANTESTSANDEITENYNSESLTPSIQIKNYEELVNAQTKAIKKIISDQKVAIDTPIYRPVADDGVLVPNDAKPIQDNEGINRPNMHTLQPSRQYDILDEIRAKCKYYVKLHEDRENGLNIHDERYKDIEGERDEDADFEESQIAETQNQPEDGADENDNSQLPQTSSNSIKNQMGDTDPKDDTVFKKPESLNVSPVTENLKSPPSHLKTSQTINISENNSIHRNSKPNHENAADNPQNVPNKNYIHINNYDTQGLPFPERQFFNTNPDRNIPKQNSKGPAPENVPIFVNNGYYQYSQPGSHFLNPYTTENHLEYQHNKQNQPADDISNPLGVSTNSLDDQLQPPHDKKLSQLFSSEKSVKYVKLSPLALQKTLVSDGKYVYYWYKAIPDYQIYLPVPDAKNSEDSDHQSSENIPQKHENLPKSDINPPAKQQFTTTSTTTTTTTTEKVPAYDVTVSENNTYKNIYEHQLKFVYPIQYPKPDVVNAAPWNIDPYAYYPKEFQPQLMNIPIPYMPTFHMIKTLSIPNNYAEKSGQHIESNKQVQ